MQPDEYRKMAEVEDRMWYYRALHRHVARRLTAAGRPAETAVLDAGCGTGGLLRHLRAVQPVWRLSGMDLSTLACQLARERTGAEITEGSVTRLPFANESFAAITSCDVLCQVEQPVEALREFWRCLIPGGVVVLTMPAYQWLYSYHDRQVANLRRYTRRSLTELMSQAGLQSVYCTYWNTLPFPLAVVWRKIFKPADAPSDVRLYPAPLEAMFNGMMTIERGLLRAGLRLPVGCSLLAVGVKPARA
jgi:ubiquinone/menaquinone biosynthesis C-methylase UbiE